MHPIAAQFDDYWNQIRGDKVIADFLDFNINDAPADVIPFLSLLAVENNPRRFRYSLAGTSVVASYGEDLSGRYFDEMDLGGNLQTYLDDFNKAVDEGCVVRRLDEYAKEDGRTYKFDGHLYPCRGVRGIVDRLIILSIDSVNMAPPIAKYSPA